MSCNRKHVRVTYSTLGSPDPLLDQYYEEDVVAAKTDFGQTFPMYIDGEWVHANDTFTSISPADTSLTIGHFQRATEMDVSMAVQAARQAFLDWSNTPWQERIELLEKVANLISERLFLLGAVISMEVGKNRLESIGEVEEAADLIRQSIHTMRENDGFVRQLESEDESIRNYSVLKPYGVWGVISPFNFPFALSAGPKTRTSRHAHTHV